MTIITSGGKDEKRRAAATAKATTLIEALPWLDEFHGATVVIKYGGHAMTADELRAGFAQDLVFLRHAGLRPVVVQGGGPQVTGHLERLGIGSVFTAGLRVTTEETIDVVRMVLNGKVNKDIVGLINRYGPYAVGLSGEDAHLITAEQRSAELGYVGDILRVDPTMVTSLLSQGLIPVVATVGIGRLGARPRPTRAADESEQDYIQTHDPLLQESPEGHALLQVPQLAGSFWRSVHTPLQRFVHVTHVPAVQFWLARHLLPHDPQLALSAVRSVHDPPQTVVGHVTQVPLLQTSPFKHALPHDPQL